MITLNKKAIINKKSLTKTEIKDLKEFFTLDNPIFHQLKNLNKVTWGTPKNLIYYEETDDNIIIPIGGATYLPKIINMKNQEFKDERFLNSNEIDIKFTGNLRDYQKRASKALRTKHSIGTLEAGTGSGKTIVAIHVMTQRKQPALVLVNTIELANQFQEKLVKFTNLKKRDIGFIGDGKENIQDVTIALLQTLANKDKQWFDKNINSRFGQVIIDEAHIVPAATYYKVMNNFSAKHKNGMTATAERADGLTQAIFFATGPIIHTVTDKEIEDHIIQPQIAEVKTEFYFPLFDTSEYQTMITYLSKDEERNQLILKIHEKVGKNRQSAFLCLRTQQAEYLSSQIKNSVVLTSDVKKSEREEIMQGLINNEINAVMTTYGLFSTGIDVPTLEVIYFCAPMKSKIKINQAIGRVRRTAENKDSALIVDFVDKNVDLLRGQWYARRKIWKKLQPYKLGENND